MPLTLNCPKCHKPFRVRDESVGMRVKCPTCAAVLQVPANLAPSAVGASSAAAPPSNPGAATTRRPAPEPARTGKAGRADSFLEDLPESDSDAGPPSLPAKSPVARTQPLKQRRDEVPERSARGAETGPLPASKKPAPKPKARPRDEDEDPEQIVQDAQGWRKVRKGLLWVQIGLFLALLPAAGNLALIGYAANTQSKGPEQLTDKGLLGKSMTLWQEIEYAYLFAVPVLAYLCVFMGRAALLRAPESARTRGTASGLFLLTLISFAAFVTYACTILLPKLADTSLPREVGPIAWTVFIYFGLTAEAWFLIYLGQVGVPLRSTRTLRDTALSILMLTVLIAGVIIANDFYALTVRSPKVKVDELLNTRMIEAGVYLVITFVFVFRVTAVAAIIRRATTRWMEERKDVLQAVPE